MPKRSKSDKRKCTSSRNSVPGDEEVKLESVDDEENEECKSAKSVFTFDGGIEFELESLDQIVCLSCEESENENEMPYRSAVEKSDLNGGRNLQIPSASPLKRASPLSPTLMENVQPMLSISMDTFSSANSPSSSKIVIVNESTVATQKCSSSNSKRRCIINGLEAPDATLEVSTPQSCRTNTSQNNSAPPSDKESLPEAYFRILDDYSLEDAPPVDTDIYLKHLTKSKEKLCEEVQYELDELDLAWLDIQNNMRKMSGIDLRSIEPNEMELLIDRLEKENYFEIQQSGINQDTDEDAVCCICLDGESDNSNQIIFCDMCNIPVHQDCFGVPFIPEGSWMCRRCSICPDGDVQCIFCPIKEGALKQTVDGRWAHVLCALWIPEVRFSNPSLVEPVDDIDDIPSARWKLICFLCKQKGVGACIQCNLRSCVTAFHASCAQAAGLSLKLETRESDSSTLVRMSASCDKHTSVQVRELQQQKIGTVNKILLEKQANQSKFQFPTISNDRITSICDLVDFPAKYWFMKRLMSYWKLRRRSRGGAALLRNLELLWNGAKHPAAPPPYVVKTNAQTENTEETNLLLYQKMCSLRSRADSWRKCVELLKTKFELENEDLICQSRIKTIDSQRDDPIYRNILKMLKKKDTRGIFAEPVSAEEAPDYFTVISTPMDFSTMSKKIKNRDYFGLEEFEEDFQLIISNCLTYNEETTVYHKVALKMKEYGDQIIQDERLRRQQLETKSDEIDEEPDHTPAEIKVEIPNSSTMVEIADDESCLKINIDSARDQERQRKSFERALQTLFKRLDKHDKYGLFQDPVDTDEVPDYLTVIEKPMDFSTMRIKINTQQYSCIQEFKSDFFLIVNNCIRYNDDDESSDYNEIAVDLKEFGQNLFENIIVQCVSNNCCVELTVPEIVNHENGHEEAQNIDQISASVEPRSETHVEEAKFVVMKEVLCKLIQNDEDELFKNPVSLEDVPDYLEIIKTPMDFSTMEKKMESMQYSTLDDMADDFNLIVNNCKQYNDKKSEYYKYAVFLKKAGDKLFRLAKNQI